MELLVMDRNLTAGTDVVLENAEYNGYARWHRKVVICGYRLNKIAFSTYKEIHECAHFGLSCIVQSVAWHVLYNGVIISRPLCGLLVFYLTFMDTNHQRGREKDNRQKTCLNIVKLMKNSKKKKKTVLYKDAKKCIKKQIEIYIHASILF